MKNGFDLVFNGFWLSSTEISRWKEICSKKLFSQRKLQLVLDLDHKLVQTQNIRKLTQEEEYLKGLADSPENISE